ncbi:MAG: LLM class flavin-dependent oxidoreductase [Reyranella sp.]|uniref:LLM class flavin-dependent oxidoreductase n=1 Tax=Reyranella sp. TaxID=1929291 RepID=UPI001AC15AD2|nr:LLM class flavin-dependent oxidoreductase [Reyranella sp.]MBN9090209.1 LLM class flavin-dependent oxidoreductase [Reyranella sp.]
MPKLGYLLPTRERVMEGHHETGALLALAEKAEGMGYDSIWVGDSLTARPRHEPLALLAAVAARTRKVELGTAVLLPALRNPVLLAHQAATLDRLSEGRLILGIGIAADTPAIRRDFEATGVPFDRRVGRMNDVMRLCRALWSGQPVDWDKLWTVKQGTVGPTPHRPGGPPIWYGGFLPEGRARTGRLYDGWFPSQPKPEEYAAHLADVRSAARAAGRDPAAITAAIYLILAIDDDPARAEARMNDYLVRYYGMPAAVTRNRERCFAGTEAAAAAWIESYADAGATHIMLRFAGDNERHLDIAARIRRALGW